MVCSNFPLSLITIAALVVPVACDLSWGTFLGADWKSGEERLRNNLASSIWNTQTICSNDVRNICFKHGEYANAHGSAVTDWTLHHKRHRYKHFMQMPIGFGDAGDKCLHNLYNQNELGEESEKLAPKCIEWMKNTELKFEVLKKRENGNDKREWFVRFATLFASVVSLVTGYLVGVFMEDHDEYLPYDSGLQNKKAVIFIVLVISIPVGVILWASPKLFAVMGGAFLIGRVVRFAVYKKSEAAYSAVSGSETGLVFAAIPVQMD